MKYNMLREMGYHQAVLRASLRHFTFNYNGLAANSTYGVRAICAPGASDWSSYITIQTDCGVFNLGEDFEGNSWTATTDWTEQGTLDACFSVVLLLFMESM